MNTEEGVKKITHSSEFEALILNNLFEDTTDLKTVFNEVEAVKGLDDNNLFELECVIQNLKNDNRMEGFKTGFKTALVLLSSKEI